VTSVVAAPDHPLDSSVDPPFDPPFDPTAPLEPGVTLLEASAGTGKTYSITTIILRLVVEHGIRVDQILAVTFTNMATAELTTRIRKRLSDAWRELQAWVREGKEPKDDINKLLVTGVEPATVTERAERARRGVESFDKAPIATIHGFCQRILQEHALDAGVAFDVELLEDARALIDEIVDDFWVKRVHDASDVELDALDTLGVSLDELRELARTAVNNWKASVVPASPGPLAAPSTTVIDAILQRVIPLLVEHGDAAVEAVKQQAHAFNDRFPPFDWRYDDTRKAVDRVAQRRLDPKTIEQLELLDLHWINQHYSDPPSERFLTVFQAVAELRAAYRSWLPTARPWALSLRHELVAYARSEAARRCGERRLWTFDDLLRKLAEAMEEPAARARLKSAVGSHYRAVFIDEFQDTDPVQWAIFSALFDDPLPVMKKGPTWLYLIGDPKQAIYRFRRADIRTYLTAKQRAHHRFTLEVNHRSDRLLVDAVNAVFQGTSDDAAQKAFAVDGFGFQPVRARHRERRLTGSDTTPLRFLVVPRTPENTGKAPGALASAAIDNEWARRHVPERAAADIARTLADGGDIVTFDEHGAEVARRALDPSDIAVLVRTNDQAEKVLAALRALGIPGIVHGPRSVYDSDEAEELVRVLRAVLEPARTKTMRAALVTRLMGVTAHALALADRDEPRGLEAISKKLREWQGVWTRRTFIEMFRQIAGDATARLLSLEDGTRRLANLLHLGELLHQAAAERDLKPAGLLQYLERQRSRHDERDERQQLRLDSDDKAVKIVTIHKAKGLEYGLVWLPFMYESSGLKNDEKRDLVFRDPSDDYRVKLDIGLDDDVRRRNNIKLGEYEVQTEQLRLLYVALTRAQLQVTVVWGAFRNLHKSALAYLLHGQRAVHPMPLEAATNGLKGQLARRNDNDLLGLVRRRFPLELVAIVPDDDAAIALPPVTASDMQAIAARAWTRVAPLDVHWRRTSFSGLIAELKDDDTTQQAASDEDAVGADEELPALAPIPGERLALADVPSGRMFGNALHKILELSDFASATVASTSALVGDELAHHGIDRVHTERVAEAIIGVLDTPLAPLGFKLRDIPQDARLPELAFVFPVAGGQAARPVGEVEGFTVQRLRAAFDTHANPLHARWREVLGRMRFEAVRGFLSGSIDLAFRGPDGRYYVIDWKTNRLGHAHIAAEYAPERLVRGMDAHHYHLQYHLYVVAFHRFLEQRLGAAYDYERDFGGAIYCFVRGMHPMHTAGTGVFYDRPAKALVDALAAAFEARPSEPRPNEARPSEVGR